MRAGWPSILFLSVALHVVSALGVLLAGVHSHSKTTQVDTPPPQVTVVLRTEARVGRGEASAPPVKAKAAVQGLSDGLAIGRTRPQTKAVQSDALALRQKPQAQVRNVADAVLCPATAPTVDAHNGTVFILDVSGSMYEPYESSTRLALARTLLGQRIRELKDGAPFALAVYAESARRSGPLVPANEKTRAAAIRFLAQDYECGGGTNLPLGLAQAEELKAGQFVLVTDGDFNMSARDLLPRVRKILGNPGQGAALTIVGLGPRPQTDAEQLLHELAVQQAGSCQTEQGGSLTASLTP